MTIRERHHSARRYAAHALMESQPLAAAEHASTIVRRATRPCIYLLLLAVIPLGAQKPRVPDSPEVVHVAPAPSGRFPAEWYPSGEEETDVVPAAVLDRPYTATVETVTPYQSPSGEPLRQVEHGFQARDRFGRTRHESHDGGMTIGEQTVKTKTVIVTDPVAHCQFHWMELTADVVMPSEMRLAFVTCGPRTLRYKDLNLFKSLIDATSDGTTTRGDTTTTTEHLVPVQIDGLTVDRLRVSNTQRNEQGQVKHWSGETWYAPALEELIRLGNEENGYTGLEDIRRNDPDPRLFYPPNGYRIEVQPRR